MAENIIGRYGVRARETVERGREGGRGSRERECVCVRVRVVY